MASVSLDPATISQRRIEQATGVRRGTASAHILKAAGVVVCLPGWGRRAPAKPAIGVTDSGGSASGSPELRNRPKPSPSASEPYRELIELGLNRGRNAMAIWQDLVSDHGFAGGYETVKRFVRKLLGPQRPEAAGIILTAPREKRRKSTTAAVRRCAIRRAAKIAGHDCSF